MGREEAESGVIFFQENQGFHALFAGYFKFVTVLRYIKEWTCCNKKGLLGWFGFFSGWLLEKLVCVKTTVGCFPTL